MKHMAENSGNRQQIDEMDVKTWPRELCYLYEERTGIKEFDGGTPREQAEKEAREEVWAARFEIGDVG